MSERSGDSHDRDAGNARARVGLLRRLLVLAVLGLAIAGAQALVSAQTVEESPDEATILLLPYLFADADAPAGYSLTSTAAHPLEADAFDAVMVPPADPRTVDTLLTRLVDAGQVVRLRQDFDPDADDNDNADDDRPELGFTVVAFGSARSAAAAVDDPTLLTFVLPNAQIASVTAPKFGTAQDAIAAHTLDEVYDEEDGPERTLMVAWQHGRLVLAVTATGSPDAADAAMPVLTALATRAEARIGTQSPLPAQLPASPAYLGNAAQRLGRYKALADRVLPDGAFGDDLDMTGVASIPNALLILDSRDADPSLSFPGLVRDRLVKVERHVLGIAQSFEAADPDDDDPSSQYPKVSVGYHLYADADGAREAISASPPEIVLRVNEEIDLPDDPSKQTLTETTSARTLGEQTRTLTGRVTLDEDDGTSVQVTTVRWRRASVELFVDVAVTEERDAAALVKKAVDRLDAVYTSRPLPAD